MAGADEDPAARLSRTEASAAVEALGWRYLLGVLCASVPVSSLGQASAVAAMAVAACGPEADGHLRVDLRPDRVELSLQDRAANAVTRPDTELAVAVSSAVAGLGAAIAPPDTAAYPRPVQMLELAIDALDIPAVRPFWRAVLGYGDEPGHDEPDAAVVDPAVTRRSRGSGPRSRPAGRSSATRRHRRSGCSPTPRATRPASARGCSGTSAAGDYEGAAD
jgi:hypothetical protein